MHKKLCMAKDHTRVLLPSWQEKGTRFPLSGDLQNTRPLVKWEREANGHRLPALSYRFVTVVWSVMLYCRVCRGNDTSTQYRMEKCMWFVNVPSGNRYENNSAWFSRVWLHAAMEIICFWMDCVRAHACMGAGAKHMWVGTELGTVDGLLLLYQYHWLNQSMFGKMQLQWSCLHMAGIIYCLESVPSRWGKKCRQSHYRTIRYIVADYVSLISSSYYSS